MGGGGCQQRSESKAHYSYCVEYRLQSRNWASPETRQVRGDGAVDRGKKWSESTHVLKLLLPGFADGPDADCVKMRESKAAS